MRLLWKSIREGPEALGRGAALGEGGFSPAAKRAWEPGCLVKRGQVAETSPGPRSLEPFKRQRPRGGGPGPGFREIRDRGRKARDPATGN